MINAWLGNPHHKLTIIHPSISKLFCKLDEELLIGVPPFEFISSTFNLGSGIYTDILLRDWGYGEVV